MNELDEQMLSQDAVASRALLNKGDLFCNSHLWTLPFFRRAQQWMTNFDESERRLAGDLLEGFLYFSDSHANQLMLAGFQALSFEVALKHAGQGARSAWNSFFDSFVLSYVEGEQHNSTDSGPECARKFRIAAEVPKARALSPYSGLAALIRGHAREIVFVDDFVGTGNQFIKTWQRVRDYGQMIPAASFETLFDLNSDFRAYFCPSVCTSYGLSAIRKACPQVVISPGTILEDRHSALHPESLIWPAASREEGLAFVRGVSARLELPETDGGEDDWRGFHQLGMAVAIRDSIPDATLRLFRHAEGGWKPLVKRV